jgi:Short C-terminal domain
VAPASTDTTAQLKKLADLHAQGVLTDEEFAAMKKNLLGIRDFSPFFLPIIFAVKSSAQCAVLSQTRNLK